MNFNLGRTATRFWVTALSCAFLTVLTASSSVNAAAMGQSSKVSYNAVGVVGDQGRSGSAVIGIDSSNSFLDSPGQFRLGTFRVGRLTGNRVSTYDKTPFQFTLFGDDDVDPIVLKGSLNGTITGDGKSNVIAKFESPSTIIRNLGGMTSTFRLLETEYALTNNSTIVVEGEFAQGGPLPTPTPEPATAAIFGTILVGLGVYRRKTAKRNPTK